MAMTARFTQNNDDNKVLVSVYDPNGKAYASFYLKPRMSNFIVGCTPQVMTIYVHREGDTGEIECSCDFSGLKGFQSGTLKKGTTTVSELPRSYYAVKSPTGAWLDEASFSPVKKYHALNSEAAPSLNKCTVSDCEKVLPENVLIDTNAAQCTVCKRDFTPTKICNYCTRQIPSSAVPCPHCGEPKAKVPKLVAKICTNLACRTKHTDTQYFKIADVRFCKNCRNQTFEDIFEK